MTGVQTCALPILDIDLTQNEYQWIVKSNAFYYQYGRKDPFPGFDNPADAVTKPLFGTGFSTSPGGVDLEESILNPTVFYTSTENWSSNLSTSLWNIKIDTVYYKTIYDPCPIGYNLPAMK